MSEWQPIETAPRDGTIILSFDTSAGIPIDLAHWLNGTWRDDGGEPTHWMPLPSPPVTP